MSYQLLKLLPEVFRNEANSAQAPFLPGFLNIIESLALNSHKYTGHKGISESISVLHELFFPPSDLLSKFKPDIQTSFEELFSIDRDDFLQWFAGWFAFVMDEDWEHQKKIDVLSQAIPLYRKRGTKEGLKAYLELYKPGGADTVEIVDDPAKEPTLTPHFFHVNIGIPSPNPDKLKEEYMLVEKIVNREKPAHTRFKINLHAPVLLVGITQRCRLGVDTYVGDVYNDPPVTTGDFLP